MDTNNPDNNIGSFLNGPPKTDAIGLKNSGEKFSFYNLEEAGPPLGLICSDNRFSVYNKLIRDDNSYIADCYTKGTDKELRPGFNKYVRVKCPENCIDAMDAMVYG